MRRPDLVRTLAIAAALAAPLSTAAAGELDGSHSSMVRQHSVAVHDDFTFARSPAQVTHLVALGALVKVFPTADLRLSNVSYPFIRPDVLGFITDLATQYRAALGAPLVVTSLIRPLDRQPGNASPLSVHPAGIAVDLRVPADSKARLWLQDKLLSLENARVLDVTREHHPSHFHVAVFPDAYRLYAAAHPTPHPAPAPAQAAPAAVQAQSATAPAEADTDAGSSHEFLFGVVVASTLALALLGLMVRVERRIEHRI